ncbi:MAG: hypothetical protein WBD40_19035 [Tepidisphaeraceae bacterium]
MSAFTLGMVVALPLTQIVVLGNARLLADHGLAFGFAGLVWALLTEVPAQPLRDAAYRGDSTSSVPRASVHLTTFACGLFALDVAAFVAMNLRVLGDGAGQAALVGLALVAAADGISVIATLFIGIANGRPFRAN